MSIQHTSSLQSFNDQLSARVHDLIEFNDAIKNNEHRFVDLFFSVLIHVEQDIAFFFLLCLTGKGEVHEDVLRGISQVVNLFQSIHQEEFQIVIIVIDAVLLKIPSK